MKVKPFSELETPFTVQSPEDMSADDVVHLFVDVFTDFPKVPHPGHAFLHGPRGSGKSMMFRYLEPDCQMLARNCGLAELPFYGIYVPVKNTELRRTELRRLEDQHADVLLNEHFMVIGFAAKAFSSLEGLQIPEPSREALGQVHALVNEHFAGLLRGCGYEGDTPHADNDATPEACFSKLKKACEDIQSNLNLYFKSLAFSQSPVPYHGPICGYMDFLFPLLCRIAELTFMPEGPIFFMIDDADNLSLTQTRVLNTWVSTRTSSRVSLKISTQLRYKTYRTVTGTTIDAPHDYSEINISTVYTASRKHTYRRRVREIVRKRLELRGITVSPEDFFPENLEQERAIAEIAERHKRDWAEAGRGHRPEDDALRYARPDYIKSLGGPSKSTHTYSYAGFDQLVHISSGIIRYFLEAAAMMYSEALAKVTTGRTDIQNIPPGIQNDVVRGMADDFLLGEFEKMNRDESAEAPDEKKLQELSNLINALGGLFFEILISHRAERRIFSIAFSDTPSHDIREVLDLGEEMGYFHVSAIGNKDGTGRTRLYILNRRLAPSFNLDPTSFAGYLFVTSDRIREAMERPQSLLRRIRHKGVDEMLEAWQLRLFD